MDAVAHSIDILTRRGAEKAVPLVVTVACYSSQWEACIDLDNDRPSLALEDVYPALSLSLSSLMKLVARPVEAKP